MPSGVYRRDIGQRGRMDVHRRLLASRGHIEFYRQNGISISAIARAFGVSKTCMSRLVRKWETEVKGE